jgi:oligosaccharide repeat unit polymerase
MSEKVELCWRALCFTPILGALDLLLILHFCLSWYRSAKRTGWKIDFWYATLFLGPFQSILILYPFNGSIYNFAATLGLIDSIALHIDKAFIISILGYVFVWLGRYTYDLTYGKFPLIAFFQFARPLCQMVEKNFKSKRAFLFVAYSTLCLGVLVLGIQFLNGEYFNGRRFFLSSPVFRPLFNATISFFPIVFTFISLRFVQYKDKRSLKMLIIFSLMVLFFGVRSLFIGGLINLFMLYALFEQGRIALRKAVLILPLFFIFAVVLSQLREGNYHFADVFTSLFFSFFYGNNFSDTRDFAWILSCWDEELLYGKSYLAAMLSFIPRSLIQFREEWSISMFTNALTGFSSDVMPGLRPGIFGESYLNFGLIGVVLFGWIFGFALRYADIKIKECVSVSKDLIKGYSHLIVFNFIACLSVSAGFWMFYIFLLVNFMLVPLRSERGLAQ